MCLLLVQVISKSSEVTEDTETEEKYLIATSEQPLCALHRWALFGNSSHLLCTWGVVALIEGITRFMCQ